MILEFKVQWESDTISENWDKWKGLIPVAQGSKKKKDNDDCLAKLECWQDQILTSTDLL